MATMPSAHSGNVLWWVEETYMRSASPTSAVRETKHHGDLSVKFSMRLTAPTTLSQYLTSIYTRSDPKKRSTIRNDDRRPRIVGCFLTIIAKPTRRGSRRASRSRYERPTRHFLKALFSDSDRLFVGPILQSVAPIDSISGAQRRYSFSLDEGNPGAVLSSV